MHLTPINGSYWVVPGKLLAGPYPGDLTKFTDAGVKVFIDLTEEHELPPYDDRLCPDTQIHHRFPVPDFEVFPSKLFTQKILETIDTEIEDGKLVYVHCCAGIGRTGMTIGCWLARHSNVAAPGDALERLHKLRKCADLAGTLSPDTDEQEDFVRDWEHCCDSSSSHS